MAKLYKLLWSFAGHRVLTVAARTGMLRRLAEGGATTDEVAGDLGLDPLATGKIVRALCALGIVEAEGEGKGGSYRLAGELQPLFLPGEHELTAFVEHTHDLAERWGEELEEWVRSGPLPRRERTEERMRRFSEAMRAAAGQLAPLVAGALDLDGVRKVLDVGGSVGVYAAAFCRAREGLRVTVLDLPEVVDLGRREVTGGWGAGKGLGRDLADCIEFRGGSYLDTDFGSGYDLVLLANVLHQEPPETAAALVRRAAAALSPGGRVAVVDFSIDDEQRTSVMGALFAINMRSFGDTYTEPTIRSWMEAAGLEEVRRLDLTPVNWLIVGRRVR